MAYVYKKKLAKRSNYGNKRPLSAIKKIVVHFTANNGDTDENNGKYFANNIVYASAHLFVDDDSVTQSVPDNYVAFSVGGSKYANCNTTGGGKKYGVATNYNTLNIELCDDVKNGKIYPSQKTIDNALELTRKLMKKYNISKENVIRHFDVTGKLCPAYWCGTDAKNKKWKTEFWDRLDEKEVKEKQTSKKNSNSFKSYKVKITCKTLNIRKGAGIKYKITTQVKKNEVYTIIEEKMIGKNKWGKLKSGAGWIHLGYTKKV